MPTLDQIEGRARLKYPPFPQAVLRETRNVRLTEELFQGRRLVEGITIDDALTPDMDDAIWITRRGKEYDVNVSISNVSALVHPVSASDEEAYARGRTRYYGNDPSSPMLPPELSEGMLSLHEGRLRPTVTVTTPLDENLDSGEPAIELTSLQSRKRFSYEEVDRALADREEPLHAFFSEYADLAANLLRKRKDKGAIVFRALPESIEMNGNGSLQPPSRRGSDMGMAIIEELMILTNTAIARFLARNRTPALFRNHTVTDHAPVRETILQKIEAFRDYPEVLDERMLRRMMSGMLKRATYGPAPQGHYALNEPAYAHFTSPIRRYADLVDHRIVIATIHGEESPYSHEELVEIGNYLNAMSDETRVARNGYKGEHTTYDKTNPSETERLREGDGGLVFQKAI